MVGCVYMAVAPLLVLMTGAALAVETCSSNPASELSSLDDEQLGNARTIVETTAAFPPTSSSSRAAVIAVATALQESSLRNLPSGDRDSLGLFQQRPSQGWGSPEQLLRPRFATRVFLAALVTVPGWSVRPLTEVASDVQRPAEGLEGAYARWESLATALASRYWRTTAAGGCQESVVASGQVAYPVPRGLAWSDRHNWGGAGEHWSAWHTGTDFSLPCGTPVYAVTDGEIVLEPGPDWFGDVLVQVRQAPGGLTTWYAHLQQVDVVAGERVAAGTRLGEIGDVGNATGCHLHFEVHLRDGGIYDADNVDPSAWLATSLARGQER
ncbi:M23 family metallopeptidase [Nocardioides bruguierae]|uniref:M23 family metallopeptidase n=1 Tax=Nocardioides bruguierae TaxID=2945102 RepID=A0A9X2D9N3_9ACTN|nr:M23 family metallopeptidase [Nocardioides bruguierae]MCM0621930.1 M23 family metallopeptidase [Nocardioides bruguierae]